MKTLSNSAAADWCRAHSIDLDVRNAPVRGGVSTFQGQKYGLPNSLRGAAALARFLESSVRPWRQSLLWSTEWRVWESSANWHLYYKLRESYSDHSLIEEASAHLFLDFEANDLVSFIQLSLMSGWDFSILPSDDYARIHVSHDEWVLFEVRDETELSSIHAFATKLGLDRAG